MLSGLCISGVSSSELLGQALLQHSGKTPSLFTVLQFITNATHTRALHSEASFFMIAKMYKLIPFHPNSPSFSHPPNLHLFLPFCSFQGEAACKEINAEIYLECSAKCRENIENVFKEATTIALSAMKKAKSHRKRKVCSVL